jgi:hypothetical protein
VVTVPPSTPTVAVVVVHFFFSRFLHLSLSVVAIALTPCDDSPTSSSFDVAQPTPKISTSDTMRFTCDFAMADHGIESRSWPVRILG